MEMETILIYLSYKYGGDWDLIYKALADKERVSYKCLIGIAEIVRSEGLNVVTIISDKYPNDIKGTFKPPFMIDLSLGYKINNDYTHTLHKDTFKNKKISQFILKMETIDKMNSLSSRNKSKLN